MSPSSERARRLGRAPLLISALTLCLFAQISLPGGLLPRLRVTQTLLHRGNELIDVASLTDAYAPASGGSLPISVIHRKGIPHRAVWLFALDAHGRLLLALRSKTSAACPATWSVLGEHAQKGEMFHQAARRGLAEEARFIARPRLRIAGRPFMYRHTERISVVSDNRSVVVGKSETMGEDGRKRKATRGSLIERQWTRVYIALPRGHALDFRSINADAPGLATRADTELARYQGMSLSQVARKALSDTKYFCHRTQALWIVKSLSVVVRVLKTDAPREWNRYIKKDWENLVKNQAPVCCPPEENAKNVEDVDVAKCGVRCVAWNGKRDALKRR